MAEEKLSRRARSAMNREAWAKSPLNANNFHKLTREVSAPIQPEKAETVEDPKGSASLAKLRAIMLDESAPLYRRLDAADVIIDYELGPGAAVNVPPEQIASTAYQFFRA